jgi:lipid-binding SYLF domain-containing protein
MRTVAIFCGLCLVAGSASAAVSKDDAKRLEAAAQVVGELRNASDNSIPEDVWNKAQCVLVIPSMKKVAFVFGGEHGSGVMSCRRGNGWTAPVFMQMTKGSWGLQAGAQEIDLVLLVMNHSGVDKLLNNKVSLGADASIAAGPVGRAGSVATDAQITSEMLSYSRSKGLFAGIDLSGGVLSPDEKADERAYGNAVTAREIVDGTKVTTPMAARGFVASLGREAQATSGRR